MKIEPDRALELERTEALLQGVIIPPCPTVLLEVLDEEARPEPDIDRIAKAIGSDVALAAGTLKVVNSPFFGLQRRVGSVQHAVRLLGLRNVVSIVMGLMLHSAFRNNKGPFMDAFWKWSNQLGLIAALVAREVEDVEPEETYALGLFIDCGVPVLALRFPNYPEVFKAAQVQREVTHCQYEDEALHTDHATVGYMVAKSWKLPQVFAQCILRHHDEEDYYSAPHPTLGEQEARQLAVLMVAQYLHDRQNGLPESVEWQAVGASGLAFLGLDTQKTEHLAQQVAERLAMEEV